MKNKTTSNFWIGFALVTAATLWLVYLWRLRREISPRPLIIGSRSQLQPISKPASYLEVPEPRFESVKSLDRDPELPSQLTQVSVAKLVSASKTKEWENLEAIHGIGPVIAGRLNAAGINTFRQLAALTPSEVEEITGQSRWDPAEWIREAEDLAGK